MPSKFFIALLTHILEAVDRLSHYRSEIRAAAITHIAVYQLGVGEICKQRVAALLEWNYFVYDRHWAAGKDKVCACRFLSSYSLLILFQEMWVFETQTAYLSPAIINTIKTGWFSSNKTLGNQYREAYVSSLPNHPDEKEFTIPLVALAVTSVHPRSSYPCAVTDLCVQ